jgi:tripartite-type tricarboxylate transporter receptor subunit TctC
VLAAHRVAAIPDVPTSGEQGVTGVEASMWNAFFLPKGVVKDPVQDKVVLQEYLETVVTVRERKPWGDL